MADDIVSFGGGRRDGRPGRDADEAIESLFHACYPHLVHSAFSMVGDWDLAEQLAQEAYLRLWRRWRWLADPQAALLYLQLYLQRTVVNLSRETIRRRVIERRVLNAGRAEPPPPPDQDAAAMVELRRAIAALPLRERQRVVLRYLPGLAEAEAASLPGVSAGAVKSRTHTGLRLLRERLAEVTTAAGSANAPEGTATDTDLELLLTGMLAEASQHPVDAGRGWRDFQLLRSRSSRNRRRAVMAAAVAAVVVLLTGIRVVAGGAPASRPVTGPPPTSGSTAQALPGLSPPIYPGAVVARIPLSGVVNVVQDGTRVWAVTELTQAGSTSYRLVGLDLRTNKATLRLNLGATFRSVAAGRGMLWMTTTSAKARGQVVRIDPVSGRVVTALHLPVGKCYYLTFEAGYLRAVCGKTSELTEFLRIDPVTGQVSGRTGPIRGTIGQVAITPAGEWYFTTYTGISGLVGQGRRAHVVTVHDPSYPVSFAYTQSLVYSQGALWALTNDESVAKIDPATGRVESVYTYGSYDPSYNGGLDFLAVGQDSLWFLDDGFPFSGLLRVSIATGRPLGGVRIRPGSCDQPCGQIYVTQNAVWVPTSSTLIRIDPARLPG